MLSYSISFCRIVCAEENSRQFWLTVTTLCSVVFMANISSLTTFKIYVAIKRTTNTPFMQTAKQELTVITVESSVFSTIYIRKLHTGQADCYYCRNLCKQQDEQQLNKKRHRAVVMPIVLPLPVWLLNLSHYSTLCLKKFPPSNSL